MEIKGIKEGKLIPLEDHDWKDAKALLIDTITEKQAFFQGAQPVLDVGNSVLGTKALNEIMEIFSSQNIAMYGVLSKSIVTKEVARKLGLITKLEKPANKPEPKRKPLDTVLSGEPTMLVGRTMRSGFN